MRNIFHVYARRNQMVYIDDKPIIRKYKRLNVKQKTVRVSLFQSDEENPVVIEGTERHAEAFIEFPSKSTKLGVFVEIHFGDTQIKLFAYPEDLPENREEIRLEYS